MHDHRSKRPRPLRDDKILADWNGLMIAALAKAHIVDEAFVKDAERAMAFVMECMVHDGRLYHGVTGERLLPLSYLDDYAFVIWGLIELYQATFEPRYLRDALSFHRQMIELFGAESGGPLYFTSGDSEQLLGRDITGHDGAIPSGNSVAAYDSVRLARIVGDESLEQVATSIISAFSTTIERNPTAFSMMLIAHDLLVSETQEVVITGPVDESRRMAREIQSWFLPRMSLVVKSSPEQVSALNEIAPFTRDYDVYDEVMVYVCVNKTCNLPTLDLAEIRSQLQPR